MNPDYLIRKGPVRTVPGTEQNDKAVTILSLPNLLLNPVYVSGLYNPLESVAEILDEQDKAEFALALRYAAKICHAFSSVNLTKTAILPGDIRAKQEHSALVAVAEAAKLLLAHHRLSELRKLHSDTLDPRFSALDTALAEVQGGAK